MIILQILYTNLKEHYLRWKATGQHQKQIVLIRAEVSKAHTVKLII